MRAKRAKRKTVRQSPPASQYSATAEALRVKGEEDFTRGKYFESLKTMAEAYRLQPNNQATLVLAGKALAKIGEGEKARQVLKKAVLLNPVSEDANTAREWLKRLDHPLEISILPYNVAPATGHSISLLALGQLRGVLSATKLYRIVNYGAWAKNADLSDPEEACEAAANQVKIIIYMGTYYEPFKAITFDSPPFSSNSCRVELHLFHARSGQLIQRIQESSTWNITRSTLADQLKTMLLKASLAVHDALL
ncbi:MAG: hypothetical protein WC600_03575 [Desulfobaccales bacterium]